PMSGSRQRVQRCRATGGLCTLVTVKSPVSDTGDTPRRKYGQESTKSWLSRKRAAAGSASASSGMGEQRMRTGFPGRPIPGSRQRVVRPRATGELCTLVTVKSPVSDTSDTPRRKHGHESTKSWLSRKRAAAGRASASSGMGEQRMRTGFPGRPIPGSRQRVLRRRATEELCTLVTIKSWTSDTSDTLVEKHCHLSTKSGAATEWPAAIANGRRMPGAESSKAAVFWPAPRIWQTAPPVVQPSLTRTLYSCDNHSGRK